MPTKRKNTVDIFPIETGNVSNQKQESDGPFQAKIKIHKQINKHSFSLITYLFFCLFTCNRSTCRRSFQS